MSTLKRKAVRIRTLTPVLAGMIVAQTFDLAPRQAASTAAAPVGGDSTDALVKLKPCAQKATGKKEQDGKAQHRTRLRQFALARSGNAKTGAELFRTALSCSSCHQIEPGAGGKRAPNLAGVGSRRDRTSIIDKVLNPSQDITPGWKNITGSTKDGTVFSGRLKAEDDRGDLVLVNSGGKELRIARHQIDSACADRTSRMPTGLVDELKDGRQFSDLIEFLVNLRTP